MTLLDTTLLVIDETDCQETDVFALVALVVPIDEVDRIRLALYRFLRELQGVPDRTVSMPPELHGRRMLAPTVASWATDEQRVACYAHVVETVNSGALQVIRVAYHKKSLAKFPLEREQDRKHMIYGLCFGGLEQSVGPLLQRSYVIPVMDGLDREVAVRLGGPKPLLHAFRASPFYREGSISVANAQNLMDPVFVDSFSSPLMQVADVTAYLLHILDWEHAGLPLTEFKARVAAVAHTLDMSRVQNPEPIWMNITP